MLQKSKKLFSVFMIAITLVCCLGMFTACKKEKKDPGESTNDGDGSGGSTPAQVVALTADMIAIEYETVVFDGTAKEPTVTVKIGETTIDSAEYSVSYSDNTNVGTATVGVSAKDGSTVISGSASKEFTITIAELPEIEEMTEGLWTGESLSPTVKIGSLVLGTDFTVAWEYKINGADDSEYVELDTATNNFVNEGYYRVTATGKGNYEGTQTAVYAIKKELSEIEEIESVVYDGDSHVPEIKVGSLVLGTDYELSYEFRAHGSDDFVPYGVESGKDSFTAAGEYKIIAKGLGLYGGTKETIFTIQAIALPDLELDETTATFDKSAKTISYSIDGLTNNVDYVVSYEYRQFGQTEFTSYTNPLFVYAGEYKVVAIGIGNYSGTQEAIFTINRATITPIVEKADYTYNAEDEKISLSGNEGGADVVYYYTADATIGASTTNEGWLEYTLGMKIDAGIYYIYASVAVSKDYLDADSNIDTFEVIKDELNGIESLNDLEITYDGESHKPTFVVTSVLNSNPLIEGEDYELEWKYFNTADPFAPEVVLGADAEFINVGYYSVTLKALGNYDISDPDAINTTTAFSISAISFDSFSVSRSGWVYGETPSQITLTATNTTGNSVLELEDVTITYYAKSFGSNSAIEITESTELDAGNYYFYAKATKDNYNSYTTSTSSVIFEVRKSSLENISLTLTTEEDVTTRTLTGYDSDLVGGTVTYYYNIAGETTGGIEITDAILSELTSGEYYVFAEITDMTNYQDYTTTAVKFVIQ